ncbi:MAG: acyl-CoA dehydrogenase [Gammaproteobacteria bacterium]|nr:acyl-CoA dehydrogenase [Gammaproteobacteria bacterium]
MIAQAALVLTEEETMLKQSAHDFFTQKMPINTLRKLRDDNDPVGFDRERWREMAALGWAGILIPEEYGGTAFGYRGIGQIFEESGRQLAASPLVSTALTAAPLIAVGGSAAQKDDALTAIATGERIVALAFEEGSRHQPCRITTRAERTGAGYRLSGNKTCVLDGHVADQLIVVARTGAADDDPRGLTLFLVDTRCEGITCQRTTMVDSRNAANLQFSNVEVSAQAVLGECNAGYNLLEPVLDGARSGLAAEMLGSALEAFDRTRAYLNLRTQFGVPIGSFQALKHRAALMFCEIELTKSAVIAALSALDERTSDLALLASLAKAKASETLELVSNEAVQLHGGIGMTDAEEIGFFLKRARVAQQLFGDASFHRDRYAKLRGF